MNRENYYTPWIMDYTRMCGKLRPPALWRAGKEVAFHERVDGSWDHCDFGTTCSVVNGRRRKLLHTMNITTSITTRITKLPWILLHGWLKRMGGKLRPPSDVKCRAGKEVAFYERVDGTWDHCDFGTTCSSLMVLNAGDDLKPHRKVSYRVVNWSYMCRNCIV